MKYFQIQKLSVKYVLCGVLGSRAARCDVLHRDRCLPCARFLALSALYFFSCHLVFGQPSLDMLRFCYFMQTFLMEFVDAQRVANNSPPCTFTPDPPLELRSMPMPPGSRPVGFLSFGKDVLVGLKSGIPFVENRNIGTYTS